MNTDSAHEGTSRELVIHEVDEKTAILLMDRLDLDQAMAELRTVYIYGLQDPWGEIRYVGQAVDPQRRLREHLMPCNLRDGSHKSRWLARLQRDGWKPRLIILEVTTSQDWRAAEIRHIRAARLEGARLTNLTVGGDGTLGRKHSPETIAKIAASKRGKIYTPEQRARMGESRRGRKQSAETIAKSAETRRGGKRTPEARAKMAAAKIGRPLTPAHRAKLSAVRTGRTFTPEHRAHLAASVRATKARKRETEAPCVRI